MAVEDKIAVPNLWKRAANDQAERPTVDLSYADEVHLKSCFDPWTSVVIKKKGRGSLMEDLADEFCPVARLPPRENRFGI